MPPKKKPGNLPDAVKNRLEAKGVILNPKGELEVKDIDLTLSVGPTNSRGWSIHNSYEINNK